MFGVKLFSLTHINSDQKMKRAFALANALSKWYKMANFNRGNNLSKELLLIQ